MKSNCPSTHPTRKVETRNGKKSKATSRHKRSAGIRNQRSSPLPSTPAQTAAPRRDGAKIRCAMRAMWHVSPVSRYHVRTSQCIRRSFNLHPLNSGGTERGIGGGGGGVGSPEVAKSSTPNGAESTVRPQPSKKSTKLVGFLNIA